MSSRCEINKKISKLKWYYTYSNDNEIRSNILSRIQYLRELKKLYPKISVWKNLKKFMKI